MTLKYTMILKSSTWATAKVIIFKRPMLVRFAITENYETALHVAASREQNNMMNDFVENMTQMMSVEDLELQNMNSNTALYLASAAGNTLMTKIMVNKNPRLLAIPGSDGLLPLHISALQGRHKTVKYLYSAFQEWHGEHSTDQKWDRMLLGCVECNLFDIAMEIVNHHPEIAKSGSVLRALARKPQAFNAVKQNLTWTTFLRFIHIKVEYAEKDNNALKLLRFIWEKIITMSKQGVDGVLRGPPDPLHLTDENRKYSSRLLFIAEEMNNKTFIIELLQAYPDLIRNENDDNHTIFHTAIMHRHHEIYSLLYELDSRKDLITSLKDKNGNNMLHLVGKSSLEMRSQMSGAYLLMQRELLWFKEVEMMLPPRMRENKNKEGQTPYELFSEKNKDLVTQGLDWMKDCMVVATLIVTVAFAVAFTVPGAYDQNSGFPIFLHDNSFLIFVIADSITLFSSSTSLLVFLSILTSRHCQRDFMYSLPSKLMIGLSTLLISVAAMMVTFSASFFVLYRNGLKWVPILIAVLSIVPVFAYAVLQFPLLCDMFRSMYDSRYLFKPRKHILYNTNSRT